MASISLCMIVKNEEKHLANCLNSVKNLVDEIIIVDTGSTDKTKDVAKEFNSELYDFNWINDFAAARNYSLEKATKEWILWLDADELLDDIDICLLKEKLIETKKIAFEVEIHNLSLENKAPFIHKSVRILKNNSNIKFMNKVHEQPSINGKSIPYYELESLPIVVNHIGYRKDVVQDKNKKDRNFEILKNELKRKPNDRFLHFNIANEYLKYEDYQSALYHYKIASNNKKDSQMLSHSLLRMVLALYELKRYEEMFFLIEEGKRKFPDYTDIYYFQGDILEKFGREEEARYLYELCLKKGNPKKNYVTRQGVGDVLPLQKLSELYIKSGYYKKAADALLKLISYDKYNVKNILSLMNLYKINFSEFDLEMVIDELFPNNDEKDLKIKLELSYILRMRNMFVCIYPKIKSHLPEDIKAEFDLFYYLSVQQSDIAKELLISGKTNQELAFIQYYVITKDDSIATYASDDIKRLIDFLNNGKKKEAFHMSEKTYLLFMEEVLKIKDNTLLTRGLELSAIFNSMVKGHLANHFYSHLKLDLAIEYYTKYLEENENDFYVTLLVAEMYLILGYEIDALKFAHQAMNLNDEHFRSIELILEVYKALNEKQQAKSLAKEMIKYFPYDHYLNQF